MSDFSVDDDALFEQSSREIAAGVERSQAALAMTKYTGKCLFCADPLEHERAQFCDHYCREFHERECHNKRVKGLR